MTAFCLANLRLRTLVEQHRNRRSPRLRVLSVKIVFEIGDELAKAQLEFAEQEKPSSASFIAGFRSTHA
jgi:hypothetical protein